MEVLFFLFGGGGGGGVVGRWRGGKIQYSGVGDIWKSRGELVAPDGPLQCKKKRGIWQF